MKARLAIDPDELARLSEAGCSHRQIADRLGVSPATASRRLAELGVEVRRSRGPELAPIPENVEAEDLRKLAYVREQVDGGRREPHDIDLLGGVYRDIIRRYAPAGPPSASELLRHARPG